jgi:hypothetical protein
VHPLTLKRKNIMTYVKPEINLLGDAANIIQDGTKTYPGDNDPILLGWMLHPAYDLDQ